MATKSDTQNLSALVINRVASDTVFQDMVSNNQINENELYLVEGNTAYYINFTTSTWSNSTITVNASTHGCGTAPMVQVQVLNSSKYEVYYGFPSTGWTVSIDSSGNITLSVPSGSEFSGRLVVR